VYDNFILFVLLVYICLYNTSYEAIYKVVYFNKSILRNYMSFEYSVHVDELRRMILKITAQR